MAALTAAGKLNATKAYPTEAEVKSLAADAMAKGDAARGEAIYRRADMQCLKCHAIAGAGGQVGPDMSSLGASAQPDYIVEALLNPNAKVKEGFNAIQVTTLSGKVVQGVKVREADGVLVLRNAEDKEESIRLDDIDARKDSRSLMADGLCDPLPTQDLLDLTRFLSELGKVGPYGAKPGPDRPQVGIRGRHGHEYRTLPPDADRRRRRKGKRPHLDADVFEGVGRVAARGTAEVFRLAEYGAAIGDPLPPRCHRGRQGRLQAERRDGADRIRGRQAGDPEGGIRSRRAGGTSRRDDDRGPPEADERCEIGVNGCAGITGTGEGCGREINAPPPPPPPPYLTDFPVPGILPANVSHGWDGYAESLARFAVTPADVCPTDQAGGRAARDHPLVNPANRRLARRRRSTGSPRSRIAADLGVPH